MGPLGCAGSPRPLRFAASPRPSPRGRGSYGRSSTVWGTRVRPRGRAAARRRRFGSVTQSTSERLGVEAFQALFDRCSNWGRWGPDDERGTLNLITPEQRMRAAGLVREGVTVSCAHPVNTVGDSENTSPAVHLDGPRRRRRRRRHGHARPPTTWPSRRTAWPTPTWTRSATSPGRARCTTTARSAGHLARGARERDHDRPGRDRLARRPARRSAPAGRRVAGAGPRDHRGRPRGGRGGGRPARREPATSCWCGPGGTPGARRSAAVGQPRRPRRAAPRGRRRG